MASKVYTVSGTQPFSVRRVTFLPRDTAGGREIHDICESHLTEPGDAKAYAADRRRLLRELDRQITDLLEGRIDEINILALPATND